MKVTLIASAILMIASLIIGIDYLSNNRFETEGWQGFAIWLASSVFYIIYKIDSKKATS